MFTIKFGVALLVVVLVGFMFAMTLAPMPYYHTNWMHFHRWASKDCAAHNVPFEQCPLIRLQVVGPIFTEIRNQQKIEKGWTIGPVELPIFDICLEHGELKRIR